MFETFDPAPLLFFVLGGGFGTVVTSTVAYLKWPKAVTAPIELPSVPVEPTVIAPTPDPVPTAEEVDEPVIEQVVEQVVEHVHSFRQNSIEQTAGRTIAVHVCDCGAVERRDVTDRYGE